MVAYLFLGLGRAARRVADYSVGAVIVVGTLIVHDLVHDARGARR
jgi:hypothetical protein